MPVRHIGGNGCGLWPTPTASDSKTHHNDYIRFDSLQAHINRERDGVKSTKVKQYPTPNTSNGKGAGSHGEGGDNLQTVINGQLNPNWVEWLMGWPIGWSDLEPLTELQWLSWETDPADGEMPDFIGTPRATEAIPRVTIAKKNRINRLKALGNGQVPQCVAMAWEILK